MTVEDSTPTIQMHGKHFKKSLLKIEAKLPKKTLRVYNRLR